MAIKYIKANLIEEKYFSNKAYTIRVRLYEHEMAQIEVDCKKRYNPRKFRGGCFCFDDCILESMYDYTETLERMDKDKGARKWLRKVMKHCTQGLEKPAGEWDWDKVYEKGNELFHKSETELTPNVAQLQIMKRYLPELFVAGNFRLDYLRRSREKYIRPIEDTPRYPAMPARASEAVRKHRARMYENIYHRVPNQLLLDMLQELSESFYKQIEKERTLDDCSVDMDYRWDHGEKPMLKISVYDKTYIAYGMPYE